MRLDFTPENGSLHTDIAVIVASFNRPLSTAKALEALFTSAREAGVGTRVVLVDASSNTKTKAVARRFAKLTYLSVDTGCFWAESMRIGWEHIQAWDYSLVLWLNDDVQLTPGAIRQLIDVATGPDMPAIAVGPVIDPRTGDVSYGGKLRGRWFAPLHGNLLRPNGTCQKIHWAEGNAVMIPRSIDEAVAGFPAGFKHRMADTIFSLRASRLGYEIRLAPEIVGYCAANPIDEAWKNPHLSIAGRWRAIMSPKGRPPGEWWRFCRELGGPAWTLYFIAPYLRFCVLAVRNLLVRPRS